MTLFMLFYVKFLPLLVSQTQLYYPVIDSHPLDCVAQQWTRHLTHSTYYAAVAANGLGKWGVTEAHDCQLLFTVLKIITLQGQELV